MKLAEVKLQLKKRPDANVRFLLPNGGSVPAHAHVTEVARIDKQFIDCGGTLRSNSFCRLQTWVSDDTGHRLTAGKLAKILDKAADILKSEDLDVDVEYEIGYITQFPVESIEFSSGQLILRLAGRHTACLAIDKCRSSSSASDFNPMRFDFRSPQPSSGCCSGK